MQIHSNFITMREKKKKLLIIIKAAANAALMSSFLLFVSFTCSKKNTLKCISLCYGLPTNIYRENDEIKIYTLKDTILIFYYSDYVIYRLPPTVKFETDEQIKGTEPYFIYNKKDSFGIFFNSLTDSSSGITCRVDSFLFNRGFKVKDIDRPVDSISPLMEVKKVKDGVVEKYGLIKQGDEMSIDTIYYYYSKKMNNIEYSFSKKLDSISRKKLFKVRLLYNSKFSSSNKSVLPKREISFEIREVTPPDPKEVFSIMKKYQNIIKTQKSLIH